MIVRVSDAASADKIILAFQEDDDDPIIDEKDWLNLGFLVGRAAKRLKVQKVVWLEYDGAQDDVAPEAREGEESGVFYISFEDLLHVFVGRKSAPWEAGEED